MADWLLAVPKAPGTGSSHCSVPQNTGSAKAERVSNETRAEHLVEAQPL